MDTKAIYEKLPEHKRTDIDTLGEFLAEGLRLYDKKGPHSQTLGPMGQRELVVKLIEKGYLSELAK